jgi:hypothetical protein
LGDAHQETVLSDSVLTRCDIRVGPPVVGAFYPLDRATTTRASDFPRNLSTASMASRAGDNR